MYYLINKQGKKLSGFYPNDIKPKLVFRTSDWYSYASIDEANTHLQYILRHNVGKNLHISKAN